MADWWTEWKKKNGVVTKPIKQSTESPAPAQKAAPQADWWTTLKTQNNYQAASQAATEQQNAAIQRRQDELARLRAQELAKYGPEPIKPVQLSAQAQAFLDPLEQFKTGKQITTRSFQDRDSVLQGKAAEAAAFGANSAALAGNETAYAKHLKAYQKAAGNLEKNAEEAEQKYLRDNPDVAYARSLSADEIGGKIQQSQQERAALEKRRQEIADERQAIRLRGEVASVDSHGVASYGAKDRALEQEDREVYARLRELEKELETLNSAKGMRQYQDTMDSYQALRNNPDFAEKSKYVSTKHGEAVLNAYAGVYTDTGYDDTLYDAVNGDKEAQKYINLTDLQFSNAAGMHENFYHISDEDREIYNYLHATAGRDEAEKFLETIAEYRTSPINAAMFGILRGSGVSSLTEAAANLIGDSNKLDRIYQLEETAKRQNSGAYKVGNIAGNVALMYAGGKLAGGVAKALGLSSTGVCTVKVGNSVVKLYTAPATTKMATSAMTFALTDAVQNAGSLAAGRMSAGEYLGSIGKSAAGGAAGSLASWLVDSRMAAFLKNHGWMTSFGEYTRKVSASTAFAATNIGTKQLLSEEKMSAEEVGQQLASSFLYSLVSSGIETIKETQQYKAQMDALKDQIGNVYSKMSDAGLTPEQKVQLAKQGYEWTQQLKTQIDGVYLPGQQNYVNDMDAALDGMMELFAQYGNFNADFASWQSGSGVNLIGGGGDSTAASTPGKPNGGPTVEEVQAELATQIQAGLQDGLQLAEQNGSLQGPQASAAGMTDGSMVPSFEGGISGETLSHPSPAAQNDTMESGRPMTAPTEEGGRQGAVPTGAEDGGQFDRATEQAVQAAREKGYTIAVREAATMSDQQLQTYIRANEENLVGARQEGNLEAAAMNEGIIQGLREVFDQRMAQSDGLEFTGALRREYGNDADAQDGGTPPHPSPAATPALKDASSPGTAGATAMNSTTVPRTVVSPQGEGLGGRPMTAPAENGGQIARATNGQEGLSYGTERAEAGSGLADSVQRDAGLGTGGQAGGLGESAGGSVSRGGRAQELAQLKNLIRASESPRTSAKAIGVRGGTNNQNLFVFSEDEQAPGMQKVREDAAANGIDVVFFGNDRLEVRDEEGHVGKGDALYQTNRDGSVTMYIRADRTKYTPEQLYKHETFHDLMNRNKGLLLDMVDDLYEKYSEAEISKMVDAYVVATDGIYGDGEDAVRLYLEEILADQYSGMNRGDKNAARAREAVAGTAQRFAGDIENARQNRAGIDRRSGPEQRFSFADAHIPTYEELIQKEPVEVVNLPPAEEGKRFAEQRNDFKKIAEESDFFKEPVLNRDTNQLCFVVPATLAHIYSNKGSEQLGVAKKIKELIASAVLTHAEQDKHEYKAASGVYTLFAAARENGGPIRPVKIKVKEYNSNAEALPNNIKEYFDNNGRAEKYAKAYDGNFLVVEEIEKGDASSSAASTTEVAINDPSASPTINIADLIDLVKGDARKYIPKQNEDKEIDWIGKSDEKRRFSAAEDEEDDGLTFTGNLRRNYEEDGGQVARAADADEGGRQGAVPTEAEDFEMLAREKKLALAEKVGIDGLKSRIETAESRLRMWKAMEKSGLMARDEKSVKELKSRIADAQETLDIFRGALKKKQEARKAEQADKAAKAERQKKRSEEKKALRKEAELADNKPRQARKEFREEALNLFSVPAAKRQALGNILNSFADKMLAKGSVDTEDRAELFRQLYEAGVEVVQAEDYYRNIRETVDKARIYVPESVRAEFGDDWKDFRQRAWGNGVYLTNDQNDRGADSWNAELAEMFEGSFDPEETDARNMLENIVDLAEEGKAEFVSLPEMMRRVQSETGVSVDEQMDDLERKVDHMIDTFAKKADLETRVRTQGAMKLAKERQKNRELAARQVQRKRENETRNEVMKQLQSLNKMRKRSAPEIQQQIDQIIGNLDTMARSISPEGMENLQALARKYMEAKDDPNFLGNPYVEARLARLSQVQLDDLEISDVIELGRTISALVKSVTEDKRLLTDEREKEISEAAKEVNKEIASSAGSKGGKLREFLGNEHLSPTRELQRIGGWNRGGMMEKLSRTLEDGGTRRMDYQRQATRIFDGFLADKANQKWLQKAQGKDADWIKVTVPAGITDEGGTVKWDNVSFEITPMMRVGLLMHSRNVDNLRHIETGGIVIPNREYYHRGDLANADAKGTRVKLRPEIVRAIVKDCTPQERAFASLLEKYYDGFSKEKINEVSMLIDGFERAGGDHYYGIKVSRKFLASLPEQIQKNMALESIGSIVNERVHAGNPIILEDASKALTDHIDLISKYYGFTAPIRDFNAVMNYTFHGGMNENGVTNPYAGSIKEALQDKWGAGAQKYIDDLLADLQQSSGINETAAQFMAKLRGNLAGASLMFNPAVALSQTASLPGAMQTLGIDGVAASLKPAKVDMGLIEKYSPVLWYRNQGNSTQELGDYMARQGLEGKLPFFFNWIQKMDAWTIRRLWAGAEYRVSKDTDLAPGSKAEIDAGTDPYYQEVARVFQRAVYDTQPNYSEMQRPAILRSKSDLTKMLTMYKTVPLQYYNMMYEAAGRLKADKARFEQDGSAENKANLAKSRSFAAKTFAGVLGANVVYVVMKAAIKALLGGKDKKYKDEEGDWDAGKIFGSLGKDLAETYAGSVIFGSELMSSMEKLYNAATTGSYSRYGGLEISALSAVEDTLGSIYNLAKELHDQDLTGGLGAIKELAKQISMDLGVPANNIETYLLGTAKWFAPEWVDRYENFFDEFERADLKGEHGKDLRAALRVLMDNRTDGLKDETIDELMRLWETGQNAAVPSGIPTSVSVDGEDVDIKGEDRSTFRERWGQVVGENLEELIGSDAYKDADDAGKAKLISKLYEYARQQAAAAVTSKQPDSWVSFGQACEDAGIPLTDYLAVASVDKSKLKDMDGEELNNAIRNRMSFRVGELDEKTLDELGRLYEAGETGVIPADVPTGISVGGEETKLTPEQRVEWLQAWQRTAGENLEALMASNDFQKADDAGKAKLISALYDVARAGASAEVVDGYAPDKWISVGMEAEDRGVPLDEYTAFHVKLSGLKSSEKLALLKKQRWSNDQKEYIWEQTMATDAQLSKYQNLKNAGVRWSDAMDRLGIGASSETSTLTEAQQAQYEKYWNEISGPATQRLLNNSAYKSADKATQTEYLDRLNDFAAKSAKAKVLSGYEKGKWVECGERLTSAGVKLDDYIVYYQNTSEGNNRAKYEALAKTGWTDSQKLIAMEYISSSTYAAGKVGQSYEVPLTSYLEALSKADADQSGNINQEEATEWIDSSSVAWDLKAYLWQMLCYSSKWKNNPFSTTRGEEIWHSLHPEG